MRLKIIDHYDAGFSLDPAAQADLFALLTAPEFLQQVAGQTGFTVEFTGQLFQPVPYTPAAPKGMPPELEAFHASADHAIVNVPPPFMFKAKIFQPSRLCAIYQRADG